MGSDVALEIIVHSKFAAVTNWPAEELSSLLFGKQISYQKVLTNERL